MNDLEQLLLENKRLSQDNQNLLDIIKRKDEQIEILQNTVTNNNSGQKYERYCLLVEYLANELKMSPSAIEEAMFSNGGQNRGIWRQHVIDNT